MDNRLKNQVPLFFLFFLRSVFGIFPISRLICASLSSLTKALTYWRLDGGILVSLNQSSEILPLTLILCFCARYLSSHKLSFCKSFLLLSSGVSGKPSFFLTCFNESVCIYLLQVGQSKMAFFKVYFPPFECALS